MSLSPKIKKHSKHVDDDYGDVYIPIASLMPSGSMRVMCAPAHVTLVLGGLVGPGSCQQLVSGGRRPQGIYCWLTVGWWVGARLGAGGAEAGRALLICPRR